VITLLIASNKYLKKLRNISQNRIINNHTSKFLNTNHNRNDLQGSLYLQCMTYYLKAPS